MSVYLIQSIQPEYTMKFLMLILCLSTVSAFAQSPALEFKNTIETLTGGAHTLTGKNNKNKKPCEVRFMFLNTETTNDFSVSISTKIRYSIYWGTTIESAMFGYDPKAEIFYSPEAITANYSIDFIDGSKQYYTLTINIEAGKIKNVVATELSYGGDRVNRVMNGKNKQQCNII